MGADRCLTTHLYGIQEKPCVKEEPHTTASKCLAIARARVVRPEIGGPTTHILQGIRGYGGRRYGLGLKKNFSNDSADDKQYIFPKNLTQKQSKIVCAHTKHITYVELVLFGGIGYEIAHAYYPIENSIFPRTKFPSANLTGQYLPHFDRLQRNLGKILLIPNRTKRMIANRAKTNSRTMLANQMTYVSIVGCSVLTYICM